MKELAPVHKTSDDPAL